MEDEQEKPTENIVNSEEMPDSDPGEEVNIVGDENKETGLTTNILVEEVNVSGDDSTNQETEVFEKEEGMKTD